MVEWRKGGGGGGWEGNILGQWVGMEGGGGGSCRERITLVYLKESATNKTPNL